jgi:hypothetical protein
MTFITVIRTGTFPLNSVDVDLNGMFNGNFTGNVNIDSGTISNVESLAVNTITSYNAGDITITSNIDMNCGVISNIDAIITKPGQTLTIQGNVEVTGNLIISGLNISIFRRNKTTTQTISTDTSTTIQFNSNDGNNSSSPGIWNGGSYQFEVDADGWYEITAGIEYSTDISNKFTVDILINNSVEAGQTQLYTTGTTAKSTSVVKAYITNGTAVKVNTTQNTGSNKVLQSGFFIIEKLSGALQPGVSDTLKIRCITGSRSGAGTVILTDSPVIPTDEVWGFTIDVVGRETGSGSRFYETQSLLAFNNAGTVTVTLISTLSSLGVGSLSGDSYIVQGNMNTIEVVVTTASTGTTNWTGKLNITSVA